MLWLSLFLPRLPLEVFARGREENLPLAITASRGQLQWVHLCNTAAADTGIVPGMGVGAAQSLTDDLHLLPRDPEQERTALEGLAAWAGQFTPTVSLIPGTGLLLEVEGSLRLFHGPLALRTLVENGAAELGYTAHCALAPTPLGAWILALAGKPLLIRDRSALEKALAPLPLDTIGLEPGTLATLKGMGLRRLGDCLNLPRAGLGRRLGPEVLRFFDRAVGRLPDPRKPFLPSPRFHSRLLLPAEVESAEALLFAARRLLLELTGVLQGRNAAVQRMVLELHHRDRPSTELVLGLVAPSRDPEYLAGLLRARLERFELPAPVDEIVLAADQLLPLSAEHPDLFSNGDVESGDWRRLVEQLRARLGSEAVFGCRPLPEHRPERAWRRTTPGEKGESFDFPPRPAWLLPEPQALDEIDGRPCRGGFLHLIAGPERIESGWWDRQPAERDYFVAEDAAHARLWIFRELRGRRRWFLHGIFG